MLRLPKVKFFLPLLLLVRGPESVEDFFSAQDDPVVPFRDFAGLAARGSVAAFEATRRGGHCGFIENLGLECWAERRVSALLAGL